MIERKAFFISGERLTSIEHKKKILVIFDMSRDVVVGALFISSDFLKMDKHELDNFYTYSKRRNDDSTNEH